MARREPDTGRQEISQDMAQAHGDVISNAHMLILASTVEG